VTLYVSQRHRQPNHRQIIELNSKSVTFITSSKEPEEIEYLEWKTENQSDHIVQFTGQYKTQG